MSDFEVDLQAMSSLVSSLSSFEEAAKEYDVEDWVPNSGMLDNPDVWSVTNSFQDTWEKGLNDLRSDISAASSALGGALGAYGNIWKSPANSCRRSPRPRLTWSSLPLLVRGRDLLWA